MFISKNELLRKKEIEKIMLLCNLHQEVPHKVILREVYEILYDIPKKLLFNYKRDTILYFDNFLHLKIALKENRTKYMIKVIEELAYQKDIFDCGVYINLLELLSEYLAKEKMEYVETA